LKIFQIFRIKQGYFDGFFGSKFFLEEKTAKGIFR